MVFLFAKVAYLLNIFILTPVLFSMYCDNDGSRIKAFQGTIKNSDGLRLLVASLWSAILILSIAGLFWPKLFLPVLMLQVIYKSLFLLTYCLPRVRTKKFDEIPMGLSISFLLIVLTYPIIILYDLNAR